METRFFPTKPYLLPWKPVVGSGRISNSSKLSCMLSLPASMKRIRSRTAEKKRRHRFSHHKHIRIFFRCSRAANSTVCGPSRPKFKLVRALMHVIITCKYEKDRMKNSREKVETPFSPFMITLWELSVAMETNVLIRSGTKPNAAFHPTK